MTSPSSDWVGRELGGRYQLDSLVARLGPALIWQATDLSLSRPVRVHVLHPTDPRSTSVLKAAHQAAQATDSRFLRVLDAAGPRDAEPAFLITEYAPGRTLSEFLADGPLTALESAWLIQQIAEALQPLHAQGIFHRRLSPDTIIVTPSGNIKIDGLLIRAAMSPSEDESRLGWAEHELADLSALGRMLYACLVARWPTTPGQRETFGLEPAPADAEGWLTPRQVRAGVSPALDVICDRLINVRPRHDIAPLTTCAALVSELADVLGNASAEVDLERRMRDTDEGLTELVDPSATVRRPIEEPPTEIITAPDAAATQTLPAAHTTRRQPVVPPPQTPRPAAERSGRTRPRRWVWLLLLLVATAVGVSVALRNPAKPPAPPEPVIHPIASVKDFDPEADGGNGEENPDQVPLAHDGNPATAWHTLTYRDSSKFGQLKPGVGLVIDLGEAKPVSAVRVNLSDATSIQAMVPSSDGDAPMNSVKSWRPIATQSAGSGTVELSPTEPVTTRYVLVYITDLPKVATARFQAAIAEVEVVG